MWALSFSLSNIFKNAVKITCEFLKRVSCFILFWILCRLKTDYETVQTDVKCVFWETNQWFIMISTLMPLPKTRSEPKRENYMLDFAKIDSFTMSYYRNNGREKTKHSILYVKIRETYVIFINDSMGETSTKILAEVEWRCVRCVYVDKLRGQFIWILWNHAFI